VALTDEFIKQYGEKLEVCIKLHPIPHKTTFEELNNLLICHVEVLMSGMKKVVYKTD
jgi:hypothetical protein